ncbi:hypothetical protein K0M31_017669 [Melipona bicolor]|uniref:Uncharacterized protein n=1 Tax=Melipona bicolor TaxID=60889 RepID=A0AA40KSN6_9HYME|nr:hypothetical protein K0M31_017669 [Melipona bicolor]
MPGPSCDKCSGSNNIIYSSNAITGNAQLMSLTNLPIVNVNFLIKMINANNVNVATNASAAILDAETNALANLADSVVARPVSAKFQTGR